MIDVHLPLAALTLWQEARGEPDDGQKAVAHVIANRLRKGTWGATLGEVCLAPSQFSGWLTGDPNRKAAFRLSVSDPLLIKLAELIYAAVNGEEDPTGGATHYYAPKVIKEPYWVRGKPEQGIAPAVFCGKFGNQLFYRFGPPAPAPQPLTS